MENFFARASALKATTAGAGAGAGATPPVVPTITPPVVVPTVTPPVASSETSAKVVKSNPKVPKSASASATSKKRVVPSGGTLARNKASVEQTYQKKSQREHILLRPDTYVGSTVPEVKENMYVLNDAGTRMVRRDLTITPGMYKILDEILVNAADNKQRDEKGMDQLRVEYSREQGWISVFNNGLGVPVVEHAVHKMYVPELIFGELLTGSNYDDSKKKTTGGRNGFGAKLANIFSSKFIVETADSKRGWRYRQQWTNNMTSKGKANTYPYKKKDFTKVTFYPDFGKFGMTGLDDDFIALLTKRVYDLAGSTDPSLRVYLNGEKIPISGFKAYAQMFLPEGEDKYAYGKFGRWEVAVAPSDGSFRQVSFVNNINTLNGGTHVTYIADLVCKKLQAEKKLSSGKVQVKPHWIKNNMLVMVNCLIENPGFDSQTKVNLTSNRKTFGSACDLDAEVCKDGKSKFIKALCRTRIMDAILKFSQFKEQGMAEAADKGKKRGQIDIDKLDDANEAGGINSNKCTLILTEGDSAKALAVSGLSVVGRDHYGVFPLKGKLLNVREASVTTIMNNAEVTNIKRILGLKQGTVYTDTKSLRYGRVMIMTDQDHDGSHIKGLVINFIATFWPSLLRMPGFLTEFITPIIKVTRRQVSHNFYTLPEYHTWVEENDGAAGWKSKYYKGLGTSTAKEAKEYFRALDRHTIDFVYTGEACDKSLELAFAKDKKGAGGADARKRWLDNVDPNTFLDMNVDKLSYVDFVNKELVLFSHASNVRAIPSVVDGLKPGQRKILFACMKRKLDREIKVAQLAGYVSEHAAYHHGEKSLEGTIVNLAQTYVGSNNVNLLVPQGQFGTRLNGGKDASSGRYTFTYLTPITHALISVKDTNVLTFLEEEGMSIEPEWYAPILPMALVNGSAGIGTGWSSSIPNYNPRDLIKQVRHLLDGEPLDEINPWYRGFTGKMEPCVNPANPNSRRVTNNGLIEAHGALSVKITELPVGSWTAVYKSFLCGLRTTKKINDISEYHTDTKVNFIVSFTRAQMQALVTSKNSLRKFFKLDDAISLDNMVLFDPAGKVCRYNHVHDIIRDYFSVRLPLYEKRKRSQVRAFEYELKELANRMRFVLAVVTDELIVARKRKVVLIQELTDAGYWSKPKKTTAIVAADVADDAGIDDGVGVVDVDDDMDIDASDAGASASASASASAVDAEVEVGSGYDYLVGMPIWSLTDEKISKLQATADAKTEELRVLRATSPHDLWRAELLDLETALTGYERDLVKAEAEAEAEAAKDVASGKGGSGKVAGKGKGSGKGNKTAKGKAKMKAKAKGK